MDVHNKFNRSQTCRTWETWIIMDGKVCHWESLTWCKCQRLTNVIKTHPSGITDISTVCPESEISAGQTHPLTETRRPKWPSSGLTASESQKNEWCSLTKWHAFVQWSLYPTCDIIRRTSFGDRCQSLLAATDDAFTALTYFFKLGLWMLKRCLQDRKQKSGYSKGVANTSPTKPSFHAVFSSSPSLLLVLWVTHVQNECITSASFWHPKILKIQKSCDIYFLYSLFVCLHEQKELTILRAFGGLRKPVRVYGWSCSAVKPWTRQ